MIHDWKRQHYHCKTCKHTYNARRGTMFEGSSKTMEPIVIVVTLISYGCPVQAIVHIYALDKCTVADWRDRVGEHCQHIHQGIVEQGKLDLVHVHADEIRVKGCQMIAWMGLDMMVSTCLWVAEVVQLSHDHSLANRLLDQIRQSDQALRPQLVLTDGWSAYPNSIRRAFREKAKQIKGVGQVCLQVWPELHIGTVIKRAQKKRVVEITRMMIHGLMTQAEKLLQRPQGGFNTVFIERLNDTFWERLASLTRKPRHAARRLQTLEMGMYLIRCTYNFFMVRYELNRASYVDSPCTPALAAGLSHHVWSTWELLSHGITPPPWIEPKRRGRPG